MLKVCSKCGKEFPATSEYFFKCKDCIGGFRGECKSCFSEKGKKYRMQNKESIAARKKLYQYRNREHITEYKKQYKEKNREFIAERNRQYYQDNREYIIDRINRYRQGNRESVIEKKKQFYRFHKKVISEKQKQYRQLNKEVIATRDKKYQQSHLDELRIYSQKRRAKKRQLPHTLTVTQWRTIKQAFGNKCAYCGKEKPLTQDHFVPLAKGGEYTHNNIIPACKGCNCSKGKKSFLDWYQVQEFYSGKREKLILEYLGYKGNVQQLSLM